VGFPHRADPDIQVKAFLDQVHRPVQQFQFDFQIRILPGQGREGRSHPVAAEARAGAQAQPAPGRKALTGDFCGHLVHVFQDALGPLQHDFTGVGEADPPRGAMQEPNLQGLFQQADALADEGVGGTQFPRRSGKALLAGHGAVKAQVFQQGLIVHNSCRLK